MFWFKSCPKCRGDLYKNQDHYGAFISCLQCSQYLTEVQEARLIGSLQSLADPDNLSP